jgi:glycerol-3-phosphate acyltransferase PlsY
MMARSGQWNFILLGFGVALCLLAIVRHKANIQRLIAGTEPKVGQKKPQTAAQA